MECGDVDVNERLREYLVFAKTLCATATFCHLLAAIALLC